MCKGWGPDTSPCHACADVLNCHQKRHNNPDVTVPESTLHWCTSDPGNHDVFCCGLPIECWLCMAHHVQPKWGDPFKQTHCWLPGCNKVLLSMERAWGPDQGKEGSFCDRRAIPCKQIGNSATGQWHKRRTLLCNQIQKLDGTWTAT